MPHTLMQWDAPPAPGESWCLHRRVLPQHTDHAGVMWHGAYIAWLEEARVEALAAAGLAYSMLSSEGFEMPVVHLAMDYRAPLVHGDQAEVRSLVRPRRGLRIAWHSWFIGPGEKVAAAALVELVFVDFSAGPGQRKVLRRLTPQAAKALDRLTAEPPGYSS
ncbi:MAG: acyl-CoA thioesterase [Cyanobium sp.]